MDLIYDPSLGLHLPLYKLDGASFQSEDKHGHLCTVTGALWTPQGRSFDGVDDFIECDNVYSFDGNDFTIKAWVRPDSKDTAKTIAAKYGAMVQDQFLRLFFETNNNIILSFYTDDLSISQSWDARQWYHIVARYVAATKEQRIFWNGESIGSRTAINSLSNTDGNHVTIGKMMWPWGERIFDGLIGEVRIYNRALTPLEIQRNYLATKWRYR